MNKIFEYIKITSYILLFVFAIYVFYLYILNANELFNNLWFNFKNSTEQNPTIDKRIVECQKLGGIPITHDFYDGLSFEYQRVFDDCVK